MTNGLTGKRVLVLEDEPLIAMVLVDILEEAGCTVVGPAHDADQAAKLIAESPIDVAVLDVNLGSGHTSAAIADSLRGSGPRSSLPPVTARWACASPIATNSASTSHTSGRRSWRPSPRRSRRQRDDRAGGSQVNSSTRLWVSGTKKMPMTTVAAATHTGYHSPE